MVRPLARWGVHPNWVTGVSILLTLAVIPLCAAGHFLAGFLCAYGMSVLDSVDGKLARLTFTDSKLGNVLDHGLDLVHPPFWYCAWAYGLTLGTAPGPRIAPPTAGATFRRRSSSPRSWMLGLYVLDRLILKVLPDPLRPRAAHARADGWGRAHLHLPTQHQLTFIYSRLYCRPRNRDHLCHGRLAGFDLPLSWGPDGLDFGL